MQNKISKNLNKLLMLAFFGAQIFSKQVFAAEQNLGEQLSSDAISSYEIDGSLFQQITDLEQEKVLLQLEKERAGLDLELDRMAAEKIKLHMEIDTLSDRADEQKQSIVAEKARQEADLEMIEREKRLKSINAETLPAPSKKAKATAKEETDAPDIGRKYRLVDIIGAANQLQATIEDLDNGQRKKISVGRSIDGYNIKSISLDEGVVFTKDGESQTLNVGKSK